MSKRSVLLLAALALAVQPACASKYQALSEDLDSYTPPQLYQGLMAGTAAAVDVPASAAGEDSFAAAAAHLREMAATWEKSLARPDDGAAFIVPPADASGALADAAGDAAQAGTALGDGFTLETLESLTLLRAPLIGVREAEARAEVQAFDQAEQIDAVLRRYSALTATSMAGPGGMPAASDFPFPAVLALKGQIVGEEVRAARERLEAARRDSVTAARAAFWELVYVGQAAEVTTRMFELLEDLGRSVESRYESGQTSFQDVVRVRIEREKLREVLRTLAEERLSRAAEIRGLLALPPEIEVGTPAFRELRGILPAQRDLEARALARRQEVRAADAMVARMERMLEMVETMTYPGFDLGLTPAPRGFGAPSGDGPGMGDTADAPGERAGAVAQPPIRPLLAADQAYVGEIRQRIAALRSEREAVRAETLVGVRNAWFAADRARREEALYATKVVGLSQSALEASLQGYAAGKVAFSDLLESYTGWFEASLARERARADIGIARAGLEAAVGVSDLEGGK